MSSALGINTAPCEDVSNVLGIHTHIGEDVSSALGINTAPREDVSSVLGIHTHI